eukprot:scaffold84067_cov18-Phaeocystis_antarctica.AAC.1
MAVLVPTFARLTLDVMPSCRAALPHLVITPTGPAISAAARCRARYLVITPTGPAVSAAARGRA